MRRFVTRYPEFLALIVLALVTRYWGLFHPNIVVWDEVHFIRFTAAYFTGNYYFDVHPPLGKLLFYLTGRIFGVSGAMLAANQPTPVLRVLPALAGSLIIPVVYLLMRELGASRRVSTLAAALLVVDNGLLAMSRYILMDAMLFLFGMVAVLCFVAGRRRAGRVRWALLSASAIAAGLAVGTKWTGAAALGLIGITWLTDVVRLKRRNWGVLAGEALLFVIVPAVVYTLPFALHFALLTHTGSGASTMPPEFQATLIGHPRYNPAAHISFFREFAELHHAMLAINLGWATDVNPASSPWYTWPVAKHLINFWAEGREGGLHHWIVLCDNPIVWWGVLYGVGAVALAAINRKAELAPWHHVLLFLAAGYVINFVPFAFIKRPMYLYHYFFGLIYSTMLASLGVGALAGWAGDDEKKLWTFPSSRSRAFYFGILGVATLMFAYLSPMSYGWPITDAGVKYRRLVLERRWSVLSEPAPQYHGADTTGVRK